jgi:hypothetical protein
VAVSLVCADEAPLLAAIEALIRQTLRREEEPGFEAEHRVPQTSATGEIIKKPKKPKKPKVPQGSPSAKPVAGKKPAAQHSAGKSKPAAKPAAATVQEPSLGGFNPFSTQKPRGKPASKSTGKPAGKPAGGARKPAGKPAGGGRGKR